MEFTVKRDVLHKELSTLRKYLSKTVPVLANFLFEVDDQAQTITITASDTQNIAKAEIAATVVTGGSIILAAQTLIGYVQNLPSDDLKFKIDGPNMKLKCKKKNMKIPTEDAQGFIQPPALNEDEVLEMDSEEFVDIVKRTAFAKLKNPQSAGDYKYEGLQLQVHKGIATFISTDKSRIALNRYQFGVQADQEFVFSGKSLEDFAAGIEAGNKVKFKIDNTANKCVIECANKTLHPALYAEKFPDVSRYVPQASSVITIDRGELTNSLQLAYTVGNDIKLTATQNGLTLDSKNYGAGDFHDELTATVTNDVELSLRASYFIEGLKSITTDDVEIIIEDPKKPVAVCPKGSKEYAYLLIPIV